ncbi:class I adenylate-forming enzyme family protein [Halovivax gelatinilyticus]|uniref:class I adenylate-forming enzyme family protein n=1 Tax=Halovivax gelatinilyticus TaxID=2961597 RepID=UPI0020CA2F1E|nr:AMP-binding protein [Halovivax gelatinilyticus]
MIPPQRRFLESHATWRPDETAIRFADTGESMSYGEFDERANRVANALHDRGIRDGDRVGLALFNTEEFPVTMYACHKLGAVPVAVNTQLSAGDVRYIVDHMNPQALVYDHEIAELVEGSLADATRDADRIGVGHDPVDGETYEALEASGTVETPPPIQRTNDDLSYMFYTSGTTGRPKGVMHSVKSGRERARTSITACSLDAESSFLALLPWYHGAGIDITIRASVMAGAEIVVAKHPDPGECLDAIEDHGITHVMSVPTLTERFADHESATERDLSSIVGWYHTGEVLADGQVERFQESLTPNIGNLYGSSESGVDTVLRPTDLPAQAGTVGRPCPGVEIRIVEPESAGHADPEAIVPQGDPGEVIMRTDQLFPGYYENAAATREAISDGWFYTNDLGVMTDDGYLEITGRTDEMIISGGELISPVEVEQVLERHEAVDAAIAVGEDDDEWGQRVTAIVAGDATADELDAHCKASDELADFKRPKAYEFVDAIDRTGAGKKRRSTYQ